MRTCRLCGEPGTTWVLIMFSWPMLTKSGKTVGIALCDKHLPELEKALVRFKPEEV